MDPEFVRGEYMKMVDEGKAKLAGLKCCQALETPDEQFCKSKVMKQWKPWHIYLFCANVGNPGWGTMYSACCCHDDDCQWCNILVGYIQSVLAMFVFGWIWSIKWGVSIYEKGE